MCRILLMRKISRETFMWQGLVYLVNIERREENGEIW